MRKLIAMTDLGSLREVWQTSPKAKIRGFTASAVGLRLGLWAETWNKSLTKIYPLGANDSLKCSFIKGVLYV
jgi:hypothetical protein